MTPKDKAEELVNKFHKFTYTAVHAHKTSGEYADAKQCALIAVDEILNFINTDAFSYTNEEYWKEVKQEIEKL
jgi:hypothetical protein